MDFDKLNLTEKLEKLQKVLAEKIQAMLAMDGGGMEVIDVKSSPENIDVYIRYLCACNGCASSSTGTLYAIESTLKEKLSKKIRVLPI